jgi:hypothetical protein
MELIKMNPPNAYTNYDLWYEYLINNYIVDQGKKDMVMFIDLGFSPERYIIWKAKKAGK